MVKVKICGITNWRDARLAVEAGADFLGFNFYPRSPRYITPARARHIVRRLPRRVRAVGVFVNESPAKIREICGEAGLHLAQLHGEETAGTEAEVARVRPVIRAVRVRRGFRAAQLARHARAQSFLLDGFHPRLRGGTGKRFDWSLARRARRYGRIFLAGGLRPENVAEAIRAVRPYAIDVCSGVESRPGRKSAALVRALMRAVRAANRRKK
jgi:phosphoribosylanthranilate isomerase